MAEVLAGLSLASNIAQFVAMGLKASVFLLQAYKAGDEFVQDQAQLRIKIDGLKDCLHILDSDIEFSARDNLAAIYRQAIELCRKMNQELDKLDNISAGGGRVARWTRAIRVIRKRSEIEGLMKKLESFELPIVLELQVCAEQSRKTLNSSAALANLGTQVRHYNSQSAKRLRLLHSKLCDLEEAIKSNPGAECVVILEAMAIEARTSAEQCLSWHRVETVLRSLHFQQIINRKSEIRDAHKSTFRWALAKEDTPLAEWLANGTGIFWIEGKAGSGKSTLMKFLEKEVKTTSLLKSWAGERPLLVGSHYFWSLGVELQRGLSGLFRTLLFQILVRNPDLLTLVCPERMDISEFRYLESWTLEQLRESFQLLSTYPQLPLKICFFIDGLDEYHGSTYELIDIIKSVSKSADIKLCVSSRPWVEFKAAFEGLHYHLRVHDLTREDIKSYTVESLRDSEQYVQMQHESPDQALFFVQEVATKSDGVFFWVYLAVRDLIRGLQYKDDFATLGRRLRELPPDLEKYFGRIFDAIESVYAEEVSTVLKMLSCSQGFIDLRLIWAYREFRDFRARGELKNTGEIDYHGLLQVYSKNSTARGQFDLVTYQSAIEEQRIIARCRDLVHVWRDIDDSDGAANITTRVGFLHRSVADFINLAEVEKKIDCNTAPDFDARTALGHAHTSLALLLFFAKNDEPKVFTFYRIPDDDVDETWKHECRRHMLKALQLAKDVKVYSSVQSRDILSYLTFAVFNCNSDDQQWEYLNRENANHNEVYAHSNGDLFGPAQFLTLMINTIESADTSVIKRHISIESVSGTTNAIEGVLALLVGHFDEPVPPPPSFTHIITSCLQPQRRLTLDQNNEPTFESRRTYNLVSLARVLKLAEAWQVDINYHNVWAAFLNRSFPPDRLLRPRDAAYEACLMLIRHGAPRFLHLSTLRQMGLLDLAERGGSRRPTMKNNALDTAILLEQLVEGSGRTAQSLIEEFRPEREEEEEEEEEKGRGEKGEEKGEEKGRPSIVTSLIDFMQTVTQLARF